MPTVHTPRAHPPAADRCEPVVDVGLSGFLVSAGFPEGGLGLSPHGPLLGGSVEEGHEIFVLLPVLLQVAVGVPGPGGLQPTTQHLVFLRDPNLKEKGRLAYV